MRVSKKARRRFIAASVWFVVSVLILRWTWAFWWWRSPTAQVLIGNRLDVHAAVYVGAHGDRLVYVPAQEEPVAGSGVCFVVPKGRGEVQWAGGAPPYLLWMRPTFMVMAGAALEYPQPILYPIAKMEMNIPFAYHRNGVEFESEEHERVRVYW